MGRRHPQPVEPLAGGEQQRRVAVGDLRAVVGLERQAVDDVAVRPLDRQRLLEGELDVPHLGVGVLPGVGVLGDGDAREILLGDLEGRHVLGHDLGEEVGEDVDLAGALVGVREVAEHLAHPRAVDLAVVAAHLLVADGDADLAHAEEQLLGDREHRLAARGAGVLDRLDRLALEPGHRGDEAGEQPLPVERDAAGGGDRGDVDGAASRRSRRRRRRRRARTISGTPSAPSLPNGDWW